MSKVIDVKQNLQVHKWLGLLVSVFMYLICLSGALVVFDQELQRWEQPAVSENVAYSPELVSKAFDTFSQRYDSDTSHYHVVFPSIGIPRIVVEDDHRAHFVNADGGLSELESHGFTQMVLDLHYYLHLPKNFGMIVVSMFGAMLSALIVSGLLAHPRIIKDAFKFRSADKPLQHNIDLHNRLSVWGTPFHLMIGITGAYFGLATIFILIISAAFEGGDRDAAVGKVFTPEPVLEQAVIRPNIQAALEDFHERDKEGELLFLTVHEANTPAQFIEIYAKQPQRLIYSENYRYKSNGEFIQRSGYADGEPGKQFIYSMYRAHFGDFAGMTSKALYFLMGLSLTVISATGVNIWLRKRKHKDAWNTLWPAFVWLTPSALTLSATVHIITVISPVLVFWLSLITGMVICLFSKLSEQKLKKLLRLVLGLLIAVLLFAYHGTHFNAAMSVAALQVNIPLLTYALWLIWRNAPVLVTIKRSDSVVSAN